MSKRDGSNWTKCPIFPEVKEEVKDE